MNRVTWDTPKINVEDLKNTSTECHICGRVTNHKSLVKVSLSETHHADDEYENSITEYKDFSIIQCQGCMEASLKVESCNTDEVDFNTNEPDITIEYYPKRQELVQFENSFLLPKALNDLYSETITAINNKCLTIAGIGIRGLIETICKEENIVGNNLYEKIENLHQEGKISSDSKEILHSLRRLYNKSAHDSFKPSLQQLQLSLDVIELLMKQIYLHADAKKYFDNTQNK